MALPRSPHVHHGVSSYTDYDRPWISQQQWLVSNETGIILSNFVAVFLAIATARAFIFLQRLLALSWPSRPQQPTTSTTGHTLNNLNSSQDVGQANGGNANGPSQPNNASSTNAPSSGNSIGTTQLHGSMVLEQVENAHSTGEAALHLITWALKQIRPGTVRLGNPFSYRASFTTKYWKDVESLVRQSSGETALALLLGWGFLILYVAFITLSILSGVIVTDSVALSNYTPCGKYYSFDPGKDPSRSAAWIKIMRNIESESAEYARRCYNSDAGADGCNYFYNQSISYTVKHNDTCPFGGSMCFGGRASAFTMKTGKIPVKTIGLNTPLSYTFERETTCSPLNMDEKFIKPIIHHGDTVGFWYFYGSSMHPLECQEGFVNCTFELSSSWKLDQPSYYIYTTSMSSHNPVDEWHPIPDLDPGNDDTINLILIQNTEIRYPLPRADPIFPASKQNRNSTGKLYTNANLHANVLACRDKTTICAPDDKTCSSYKEFRSSLIPKNDEATRVSIMLIYSLLWSDTLSAFRYRDASALDAHAKLVGGRSFQLAPEQWKIEVQQAFETILARIQIDANNIARGMPYVNDFDFNELYDIVPPGVQGLCEMYKFKSTGWKNVNVAGFLGSLGAGLLVLVLGIARGDGKELWIEKPLKAFARDRHLKRWGIELVDLISSGWQRGDPLLRTSMVRTGEFLTFLGETCRKVASFLGV